jgi:hypothetical protein
MRAIWRVGVLRMRFTWLDGIFGTQEEWNAWVAISLQKEKARPFGPGRNSLIQLVGAIGFEPAFAKAPARQAYDPSVPNRAE